MGEGKDVKVILKSYIPALKYAMKCIQEWDDAEDISISSPRMDGMPRNPGVHGLETQVALIERYRKRAEKERDRALKILDEVERLIDSLDDEDQRNVLRKRYIDGMEWAEVAIYANMSERTVFYVHGRALNELRRRECGT